jgi:hypothetical protein
LFFANPNPFTGFGILVVDVIFQGIGKGKGVVS